MLPTAPQRTSFFNLSFWFLFFPLKIVCNTLMSNVWHALTNDRFIYTSWQINSASQMNAFIVFQWWFDYLFFPNDNMRSHMETSTKRRNWICQVWYILNTLFIFVINKTLIGNYLIKFIGMCGSRCSTHRKYARSWIIVINRLIDCAPLPWPAVRKLSWIYTISQTYSYINNISSNYEQANNAPNCNEIVSFKQSLFSIRNVHDENLMTVSTF